MDVFGSIAQWARDVWNGIHGAGENAVQSWERVWHLSASIVTALAWLVQEIVSPALAGIYSELSAIINAIRALRDALDRVAWWVDTYMIIPAVNLLNIKIFVLRAWTFVQLAQLRQLVYTLHLLDELHTDLMVGAEARARVAAITAARAYAKALTDQLHQVIEQEAVSGYRQGSGARANLIGDLARDLNVRGIIDKATTDLLTKAIDTLVTIDDPVLGAVARRIVGLIISKSGIGADLADLIERLIIPGAGGATPKNLPGVIADLTYRIGQVEAWIAKFMLDGGPEVEDAGRQWKALNSLTVDAALVAFFGQAVVAPEAWAREVDDVIGTVAQDTIGSIISLIRHV